MSAILLQQARAGRWIFAVALPGACPRMTQTLWSHTPPSKDPGWNPWHSLNAYMQSVLAHHCQREGICGCMSRLMRHTHVSVDQTFLNPFSLSHDDCQRRVCAAWSFGSQAMGATPPHGFTWIAKALLAPAQEDGRRRE